MSESVRPTKKQRELLDFIENFIAEHGYSPSYREIMNGLQYNSVATVALHIGSLIKRGHLRKRDHSARSLEVVRDTADGVGDNLAGMDGAAAKPTARQHEDWLLERVESHIKQLAEAEDPDRRTILSNPTNHPEAHVLLNALEVLGLSRQAEGLRQGFLSMTSSTTPVAVPVPVESDGRR
jgi:SOS-response transcriptional repressor LexA